MPSRLDPDDVKRCKEAIAEHMAKHKSGGGPICWKAIRASHPNIKEQSLHRFIRAFRESPDSIKEAISAIQKRKPRKPLKKHVDDIVSNLPVAPSPAYVTHHGETNLDLLGKWKSIYARLEDMIQRQYREDGSIKNPKVVNASIANEIKMLDTALRAIDQVWNLKQQQFYFDLVFAAIMEESPECMVKIRDRLAVANAKYGISIDTRV